MNYRHAYHAGNFADVLKHSVLALTLQHLKLKDAPFRVIDTHAGIARYDLAGPQAAKTGEWSNGIGRLLGPGAAPKPADITAYLAPYLEAVTALNTGGDLARYPGSPLVALALMRKTDRLVANELHPEDAATLDDVIGGDRRVKVLQLDAYTALKSLLPPPERRGVVLVDPPFEARDEFDRLMRGLREATRRFATGTYLIWYPIKDRSAVAAFHDEITVARYAKAVAMELAIGATHNAFALNACGLIVINPPHTLNAAAETLLPYFAQHLAQGPGAASQVRWLGTERIA
ncbi:MAG: 23S rRNA (adenine(2030)-N(6))-methyltransferase RlmJ [Sphingomonadales bacterium]|nr:23S rRNA (adenine(2030)-N(6))-methyltransferase RlmJ [Sphingomonadales bacterium]